MFEIIRRLFVKRPAEKKVLEKVVIDSPFVKKQRSTGKKKRVGR